MEKSKKEEAKLEAEETFWEGPPSSTEAPQGFIFLLSFAGILVRFRVRSPWAVKLGSVPQAPRDGDGDGHGDGDGDDDDGGGGGGDGVMTILTLVFRVDADGHDARRDPSSGEHKEREGKDGWFARHTSRGPI